MDKDFAKRLKNFEKIWARVQGAKEPEKAQPQSPHKKPCQKKRRPGPGRRF